MGGNEYCGIAQALAFMLIACGFDFKLAIPCRLRQAERALAGAVGCAKWTAMYRQNTSAPSHRCVLSSSIINNGLTSCITGECDAVLRMPNHSRAGLSSSVWDDGC